MSGYPSEQATARNQVKEIVQLNLANSMRVRQKNIAGKCFTTCVAWGWASGSGPNVNYGPLNANDNTYYNIVSLFNPTGSGKLLYVYGINIALRHNRISVLVTQINAVGTEVKTNAKNLADTKRINSLNTSLSTTSIAHGIAFPTLTGGEEVPEKVYWITQVSGGVTAGSANGIMNILEFIEDHIILAEGKGILVRFYPQDHVSNTFAIQLKWYEE